MSPSAKFQLIEQHADFFDVSMMCRLLHVSTSGFYGWRKRPVSRRQLEDEQLTILLREIFEQHKARYGALRIWKECQARGLSVGRDRVRRLLKEAGLHAKTKRAFKPATTDSAHSHRVYENLLMRNFKIDQPNRVWLADITYLATKEGWVYLAGVMDMCSRRIVGWDVSESLDATGAVRALQLACANRKPVAGLVHHSDRGVQYASRAYQQVLEANEIKCSMSRAGNCWDNAPMESFFGRLKEEIGQKVFETKQEAVQAVFKYIEMYYNRIRRHSALGYLSPLDFEARLAS